jgi:hypothetical protein
MKSKIPSRVMGGAIALAVSSLPLLAQPDSRESTVPIYRVTVIERTMKAINYKYRNGPTIIDFRGTVLLPKAKGEAIVESHQGRTQIDAKFENLSTPQGFGLEYMTYVLWAITPEAARSRSRRSSRTDPTKRVSARRPTCRRSV